MKKIVIGISSAVLFWLCITSAQAEVFGELSHDLDGVSITYHYASGRQYDVSFTDGTLGYLRKDVPGRELISGIPYIARKIKDNLYLVNWHRPELTEYITVLMDFDERVLYTSALLEGTERHFDEAEIVALSGR